MCAHNVAWMHLFVNSEDRSLCFVRRLAVVETTISTYDGYRHGTLIYLDLTFVLLLESESETVSLFITNYSREEVEHIFYNHSDDNKIIQGTKVLSSVDVYKLLNSWTSHISKHS